MALTNRSVFFSVRIFFIWLLQLRCLSFVLFYCCIYWPCAYFTVNVFFSSSLHFKLNIKQKWYAIVSFVEWMERKNAIETYQKHFKYFFVRLDFSQKSRFVSSLFRWMNSDAHKKCSKHVHKFIITHGSEFRMEWNWESLGIAANSAGHKTFKFNTVLGLLDGWKPLIQLFSIRWGVIFFWIANSALAAIFLWSVQVYATRYWGSELISLFIYLTGMQTSLIHEGVKIRAIEGNLNVYSKIAISNCATSSPVFAL